MMNSVSFDIYMKIVNRFFFLVLQISVKVLLILLAALFSVSFAGWISLFSIGLFKLRFTV